MAVQLYIFNCINFSKNEFLSEKCVIYIAGLVDRGELDFFSNFQPSTEKKLKLMGKKIFTIVCCLICLGHGELW